MSVATVVGITGATFIVADLVCNLMGLFPPRYEYGDPDVGWLATNQAASVHDDRCLDPSEKWVRYARNEDGIRTQLSVARVLADRGSFKIGVTGDSQTDLCAKNSEVHSGILEGALNAGGVRAIVLPYGVGRYSPLQDYLAYKKLLKKYAPQALVLNFYTGNDFYDLLRVDDRPHFVESHGRYQVAGPVWYRYEDPRVRPRSRVRFLLHSLAEATGVRNAIVHLQFLYQMAVEQRAGVRAVVGYFGDLRQSVEPSIGYQEAFTAQFLNQQIFFYRFPGAREESIRRVRALLELARRENPNTVLILSALPSYELIQQRPVDAALSRTLERLPVTYESGVREEHQLYDTLRQIAGEEGWLFVDNLTALRGYRGSERLYNNFDYHLLPTASTIIGNAQAAVILRYLRAPRTPPAAPAQVAGTGVRSER